MQPYNAQLTPIAVYRGAVSLPGGYGRFGCVKAAIDFAGLNRKPPKELNESTDWHVKSRDLALRPANISEIGSADSQSAASSSWTRARRIPIVEVARRSSARPLAVPGSPKLIRYYSEQLGLAAGAMHRGRRVEC